MTTQSEIHSVSVSEMQPSVTTLSLPAVRISQNGIPVYVASMSARELAIATQSKQLTISDDGDMAGTQRPIATSRVNSIRRFLTLDSELEHGLLLGAVALMATGDSVLTWEPSEVDSPSGTLRISGEALSIVDGQHRVGGVKEAAIEGYRIPVTVVEGSPALLDATFGRMNFDQRRLSKGHKYVLDAKAAVQSEQATRVIGTSVAILHTAVLTMRSSWVLGKHINLPGTIAERETYIDALNTDKLRERAIARPLTYISLIEGLRVAWFGGSYEAGVVNGFEFAEPRIDGVMLGSLVAEHLNTVVETVYGETSDIEQELFRQSVVLKAFIGTAPLFVGHDAGWYDNCLTSWCDELEKATGASRLTFDNVLAKDGPVLTGRSGPALSKLVRDTLIEAVSSQS